jgi:pimeloyl-ACP methyl ester carboxylesterase
VIAMPSAFIGGDLDPVLGRDRGGLDRMAAALPGYQGHTLLAGVGHWTQQEDPGAFNRALLDVLAHL